MLIFEHTLIRGFTVNLMKTVLISFKVIVFEELGPSRNAPR